jgi:hypothetical protein
MTETPSGRKFIPPPLKTRPAIENLFFSSKEGGHNTQRGFLVFKGRLPSGEQMIFSLAAALRPLDDNKAFPFYSTYFLHKVLSPFLQEKHPSNGLGPFC